MPSVPAPVQTTQETPHALVERVEPPLPVIQRLGHKLFSKRGSASSPANKAGNHSAERKKTVQSKVFESPLRKSRRRKEPTWFKAVGKDDRRLLRNYLRDHPSFFDASATQDASPEILNRLVSDQLGKGQNSAGNSENR